MNTDSAGIGGGKGEGTRSMSHGHETSQAHEPHEPRPHSGPADGAADFAARNARRAAERASELFDDAADSVKAGARSVAEEQKAAGAERIGSLGKAMHGAADELGKEIPGAAEYIHSTAERLESASSALRDRSVDEFVHSVSRFMRRQPAAAFAGSVILGFALSRFLRSSGQ